MEDNRRDKSTQWPKSGVTRLAKRDLIRCQEPSSLLAWSFLPFRDFLARFRQVSRGGLGAALRGSRCGAAEPLLTSGPSYLKPPSSDAPLGGCTTLNPRISSDEGESPVRKLGHYVMSTLQRGDRRRE
ncbi:Renalase [Manis pentadactyla]|nr:Renalase [Manis pentadactyla]